MTTQELTKRELGQILYLRPEWEDDIDTEVSNLKCRETPPIRIYSEIGITGAYWLRILDSVQKYTPLDFCETRYPWLSNDVSM